MDGWTITSIRALNCPLSRRVIGAPYQGQKQMNHQRVSEELINVQIKKSPIYLPRARRTSLPVRSLCLCDGDRTPPEGSGSAGPKLLFCLYLCLFL